MKTLVICVSVHHGNTRKIAQAMAEVLDADVLEPANIDVTTLDEYDLWGECRSATVSPLKGSLATALCAA